MASSLLYSEDDPVGCPVVFQIFDLNDRCGNRHLKGDSAVGLAAGRQGGGKIVVPDIAAAAAGAVRKTVEAEAGDVQIAVRGVFDVEDQGYKAVSLRRLGIGVVAFKQLTGQIGDYRASDIHDIPDREGILRRGGIPLRYKA